MYTPGGLGGQLPSRIQSAKSGKPPEQKPENKTGNLGTHSVTWFEGVRNAYEDFMEMESNQRTLEQFLEMVFIPFFTTEGYEIWKKQRETIDNLSFNQPAIPNQPLQSPSEKIHTPPEPTKAPESTPIATPLPTPPDAEKRYEQRKKLGEEIVELSEDFNLDSSAQEIVKNTPQINQMPPEPTKAPDSTSTLATESYAKEKEPQAALQEQEYQPLPEPSLSQATHTPPEPTESPESTPIATPLSTPPDAEKRYEQRKKLGEEIIELTEDFNLGSSAQEIVKKYNIMTLSDELISKYYPNEPLKSPVELPEVEEFVHNFVMEIFHKAQEEAKDPKSLKTSPSNKEISVCDLYDFVTSNPLNIHLSDQEKKAILDFCAAELPEVMEKEDITDDPTKARKLRQLAMREKTKESYERSIKIIRMGLEKNGIKDPEKQNEFLKKYNALPEGSALPPRMNVMRASNAASDLRQAQ